MQGRRDSNPRPTVLERVGLPRKEAGLGRRAPACAPVHAKIGINLKTEGERRG